jgi:hypothetical protein
MVRFMAETGIFSRPEGEEANPEPVDAEVGTLVDNDRLGRVPSDALLLAEAGVVAVAEGGFVGDEEWCR